jgi:hypothetical protein
MNIEIVISVLEDEQRCKARNINEHTVQCSHRRAEHKIGKIK